MIKTGPADDKQPNGSSKALRSGQVQDFRSIHDRSYTGAGGEMAF